MDVTPSIRAASRIPPEGYQAYLASEAWRKRRNRALQLGGFKCVKCGAKRDLQVHHRSYERLGAELDTDLEVKCGGCHNGGHFNEFQDDIGVYSKLVSRALQTGCETISDVKDTVREICIAERVAFVPWKIDEAITRLSGNRLPVAIVPRKSVQFRPADDGAPIGRSEAAGILARLRLVAKPMPEAFKTPAEQQAHEEKILDQARVFRASSVKRQPLIERLAALFDSEGL